MEKVLVGNFEPENNLEVKMMLERRLLFARLEENGINCINIDCTWPRDYFVNHNGKICERKNYGFYSDGGYVINNPEFTLACSEVSFNEDMYTDTSEERYKLLQALYGNNIFILPPPDKNLNFNLSPHIDLVVLPIPERNILFVDSLYYNRTAKSEIDNLCERYNLRLERAGNDYSKPSYPCNSLILNNHNDLTAVTNKTNNEGFIFRLRDYGLNVIDVPFEFNCNKGGSVRCATNTIPENYTGSIEDLLKIKSKYLNRRSAILES